MAQHLRELVNEDIDNIHFLEKFVVPLSLDECAKRLQSLHQEGSWFDFFGRTRIEAIGWKLDDHTYLITLTQFPKQKTRVTLLNPFIRVYCTEKNKNKTAIWIGYFPALIFYYFAATIIIGGLGIMELSDYSQDSLSITETLIAFIVMTISIRVFAAFIKFYFWLQARNLVRKVKDVLDYPLEVV